MYCFKWLWENAAKYKINTKLQKYFKNKFVNLLIISRESVVMSQLLKKAYTVYVWYTYAVRGAGREN